jgi:hypothetical protein
MFRASPMHRSIAMRFLPFVLPLALAAACDNDTNTGIPLAELDRAYAQAACDSFVQCARTLGFTETYALFEAGADRCADFFLADFENLPSELVASGHVTYDGVKAKACFDKVATTCVAEDPTELPECRDAFKGTLQTGAACAEDVECAGDAFCKQVTSSACPGVCTPRAALGAACDLETECTALTPALCDYEAKKCVAPPAEVVAQQDEFCGDKMEGGVPVTHVCAEGLGCLTEGFGDGTCKPYVPANGDCSMNRLCAFGTQCQKDEAGLRCLPLEVVTTEGGACNETDENKLLGVCDIFSRMYCSDEGKCAVETGELDTPCRDYCKEGLYCENDKCLALKTEGSDCGWGGQCASGYCNDQTMKCEPLVCE